MILGIDKEESRISSKNALLKIIKNNKKKINILVLKMQLHWIIGIKIKIIIKMKVIP